jgi:hypothetical protein
MRFDQVERADVIARLAQRGGTDDQFFRKDMIRFGGHRKSWLGGKPLHAAAAAGAPCRRRRHRLRCKTPIDHTSIPDLDFRPPYCIPAPVSVAGRRHHSRYDVHRSGAAQPAQDAQRIDIDR